jgi:YihY family inner membrane protein
MTRVKTRILHALPVRALRRFLGAQGPNWATIIAWNLFFAFFPIVILAITAVGLVLHDPGARATIEQQIFAAFPSCRAQQSGGGGGCQIISVLNDFRTSTGVFAVVGILGLVWSGSSLFGAMEQGLNSLYACTSRGFLRQKLMAMGMVVVFTVMAVPLVVSGSVLSLLQALPGVPDFLRSGPASLLIQLGAGIVDASLLFGIIFFVVPHRRQQVRDIIPGALFAGVLFEALTLLFPLYFQRVSHSPQWGQTFAFIFLLLFYFLMIGEIIMLGGALNAELALHHEAGAASGLPAAELSGAGDTSDPPVTSTAARAG